MILSSIRTDRYTDWGLNMVDTLSKDLQAEYPSAKGLSSPNLRRMRLIFEETAGNEMQVSKKVTFLSFHYSKNAVPHHEPILPDNS